MVAGFGGCNGDIHLRLFQEMLDHRDQPFWLRKRGKVTGIRDHCKFGVWDELEGLNGMLNAYKVVISDGDENRRFDGGPALRSRILPIECG